MASERRLTDERLAELLERWNREANEQTQDIVDVMIATMIRCLHDDLHASDEQIMSVFQAMKDAVERLRRGVIRCDEVAPVMRMKTPHHPISLV